MKENNLIVQDEHTSMIDRITENIKEVKTLSVSYEDKRDYIIDKINEFMSAVEQNQPKAHLFTSEADYDAKKSPYIHHSGKNAGKYKSARHRQEFEGKYHWSAGDSLDTYLMAVIDECDLKLADAKEKIKTYSNSIETPFQQQIISPFYDEMTNVSQDETKRFDKTFYEFLEWHIPFQKQTIISFLNGTFEFKEEDIVRANIKTELAKMILEAGDKQDDLKIEAEKIINKNKIVKGK